MKLKLRHMLPGVFAVLLVLTSAPAAGQQPDDEAAPPPPTLEEIERGRAEDPDARSPRAADAREAHPPEGERAGWTLLERAVEHLARGEHAQAHRLLEQLADEYAGHPAAEMSAGALAALRQRQARKADPAPDAAEETSGLARAELAFFQTLHGLALGGELCLLVDCDDPKAVVAALGGGAALGLGASLALTSDGITPGHALLLNSGTTWGFANGLLVSIAADADFEDATGMMVMGQLAGLGASALIWDIARPTAGQVSMANSGGFWSGYLALWAHGVNNFDSDGETVAMTMLAAADLGVLGGALLSRTYPMSRGRTFVIDSGGILGSLTGMGTYVLLDGDFRRATGFSLANMLGTLAGLGTATYLTRDWDAPDAQFSSASWSIMPTEDGAMLTLGGAF